MRRNDLCYNSDMNTLRLPILVLALLNVLVAGAGGVKIVAHRGACDLTMPEASSVAYSNAVAGAADIVKLDVSRTLDDVAVMSHDPNLKRNMGWDAEIKRVTYAEILEKGTFLPVGGHRGLKIMTLGEALDIVKNVPQFWLDFKGYTPAFAEKAIAEFTRRGIAENRVMCATFNYQALAYLKEKHPDILRVAHVSLKLADDGSYTVSPVKGKTFKTKREALDALLDYRDKVGLYGVNMPVANDLTLPEDVAYLKSKGLWVSLWFVQTPATARRYRTCGADAFVTDHASAVRP